MAQFVAHAPFWQTGSEFGVKHASQLGAAQPVAGSSFDTQSMPQSFWPVGHAPAALPALPEVPAVPEAPAVPETPALPPAAALPPAPALPRKPAIAPTPAVLPPLPPCSGTSGDENLSKFCVQPKAATNARS
jgi:hypothetical protein